jgi:hypothetical protein
MKKSIKQFKRKNPKKINGIGELSPFHLDFVVDCIKDTWDTSKHDIKEEIAKALTSKTTIKLAIYEKGVVKAFFIILVFNAKQLNPIGVWAKNIKYKFELYRMFKTKVLPNLNKPVSLYYTINQNDYFRNNKIYDEQYKCYKVVYE